MQKKMDYVNMLEIINYVQSIPHVISIMAL